MVLEEVEAAGIATACELSAVLMETQRSFISAAWVKN